METKADILDELAAISPMLAGMRKLNVFTVPAGYFNSISETVVACVREGIVEATNIEKGSNQFADVPEGYFDHLAANILSKIKAVETASTEISNLSPTLHAIQNKNVFEVPGGYFESINRIITDKIKTDAAKDELKEISPLLYGLQKKVVFEVPVEYFTDISETILKKVQTPKTKVVPVFNISLLVKYAAAAMMTGVLALGIYKYTDKPAVISDEHSVASLDAAIEKGKNMNDKQFNEAMASLSESDIANYLEKNGSIADVAVLGNDIEASSLPSPEEYLLDETTLENYLKEIDNTSLNN